MKLTLLLATLLITGCVGGTLSDTKDMELYPLREATAGEAKSLKRCLKSVHRAQTEQRKKTGRYYRKVSDMSVDDACQGIMVAQKGTAGGYEVAAQINRDETTVRWSVDQDGQIEEHLDPAYESVDTF